LIKPHTKTNPLQLSPAIQIHFPLRIHKSQKYISLCGGRTSRLRRFLTGENTPAGDVASRLPGADYTLPGSAGGAETGKLPSSLSFLIWLVCLFQIAPVSITWHKNVHFPIIFLIIAFAQTLVPLSPL
jgi:hypothetical protein